MPYTINKDLTQLLAQLLNKVVNNQTSLPNLYIGLRASKPLRTDTLATINGDEVNVASYLRIGPITLNNVNFPDAASGNDWNLNGIQQAFAAFTGGGTQAVATHMFVTDQANGYVGKLYWQGPLNPYGAPLSTTLSAAANAAQAVVALTSVAGLTVGDYLLIDSYASGIQEWLAIASIAGNNVTLAANLASTHASGAVVTQDGVKRTYAAGMTEKVTPTLVITQG